MPSVRTHPGDVLRGHYLAPLGLSARTIAKDPGVPANRITGIMRGERDVSADTATASAAPSLRCALLAQVQTAHDRSQAQAKNIIRRCVQGRRRDSAPRQTPHDGASALVPPCRPVTLSSACAPPPSAAWPFAALPWPSWPGPSSV
jgi:addiction module HigA family antidote